MDTLLYKSPSKHWKEALPVGNGKTAVMIYGGDTNETLCFNDVTLWSGYPKDQNSKKSLQNIDKVRDLIFKGKNHRADVLAQKTLKGGFSETFLPLGTVKINFDNVSKDNFSRKLNLSTAIHTVETDGVLRECFSSNPDKVTVYKINAKEKISLNIEMDSELKYSVSCDNGMNLFGNAPDHDAPIYHKESKPIRYDKNKAMAYCLRLEVKTDGEVLYQNNKTIVKNANEVVLYFATETGYIGFNKMPITDTSKIVDLCKETLSKVNKNYDEIKNKHIDDFSSLFNRQSVSFGIEDNAPTDELIKKVKKGDNMSALSELFYNYGKFLMISGSRIGGQPLNLQGQWNSEVRPPWSSNYTTNINTEMNYWGASRCGLFECIEPLINMLWEMIETGSKTAKTNYDCDGFCCNHNTDIWRKSTPCIGSCSFMFAPLCGAWLTNEICAHYLNGGLEEYKDKIIKITEESAKFVKDFLVMHDGQYVICPSTSPENSFRKRFSICFLDYATAFDMAVAKQALHNALECTEDEKLKEEINKILPKLYPFKKGKTGIMEYHDDFSIIEKGHRHFSPLYAFYPAKQIEYYNDPEKTEWVRELFHYRLDHSGQHIGWSAAWAICLSSKLREPETNKGVIKNLLCNAIFTNLFCYHPPTYFQIDGNFGYIAGINEMLLSEEKGVIELLPGLIDDYKDGYAKNMFVNGVKVSFTWKNGKITSIESDKGIKVYSKNLSEDVKFNDMITLVEV